MSEIINPGHFQELSKLHPEEVCKRAGCSYDKDDACYSLMVWGSEYKIFPGQATIKCVDHQDSLKHLISLFALHYLLTCAETIPSGNWISEKDMPGGVTFFRGPHEIPTHLITEKADNSVARFKSLCESLGGTPLEMADAAYTFHITERIPVAVLYWEGDEDFPAEAKLLYDRTLTDHFALDIIYCMAVGICEKMGKQPLPV